MLDEARYDRKQMEAAGDGHGILWRETKLTEAAHVGRGALWRETNGSCA